MKIGLALGSGSARGWSHIGVIKALAEQGIHPDIVCGTSIGSLVGAAYAFGNLDALETWVRSLTKLETARFFNINRSFNGFVDRDRLHQFFCQHVATDEDCIETCSKLYAAVATELDTGRELWFTEGPVLEAVWSSIALPGLLPAIRYRDKWLVDGGLVNPVPVSVCRALGADVVIAVNLNGDLMGRGQPKPRTEKPAVTQESPSSGLVDRLAGMVADYTTSLFPDKKASDTPPNLFEAIAGSINITQDRITRSRMAGDPPDILLNPKLAQIGLLEFYRADEAITEGYRCVQRMLPEIEYLFELYDGA